MRAKLLLGFPQRQKTYRGRAWQQPFQTSLQTEKRALLAPNVSEDLLPGLGAKVRCRRIMRSRIQWKRSASHGVGALLY